jgi:two-component system chemotaxis response regulator CheY
MKKSLKILVIDDSPFIFKAVKRALEPQGCEIVGYADNGKSGIEMYENFKPDVVTLDITMPVMDGLETASSLMDKDPEVKIIMISAMGDEALIQSAQKIGIRHFLSKPFKPDGLIGVINDLYGA